ncbi:MAG: glycosyltransferase family 4 protein [Methanoregulaceae archaeon]|nr:glycosyltransferase family 4 protein [Methanoregulaceae archaeon]
MKVALTCGMDFSRPNGITRYVEAVASGVAQNHEVHLLSSDEPPQFLRVTAHVTPLRNIPGMRIHTRVHGFRTLLNVGQITTRLLFNACYYRSRYRELKKTHHCDIFHSQSLDSPVADVVTMHSCYAAAWGRKKGEVQGPVLRGILGYLLFLPFNRGSLAIERRILHRSRKIIAVSTEVKQQILTWYPIPEDKIVVIPNGVDSGRFRPDPGKGSQLRARYGISDGEMVLIFVGNLFQVKGLDLVISTLEKLEGVTLFVIGEDVNLESYRNRVQNKGLQDRIIFTGRILSGIEDYYAASDAFVLPSESEGLPLSALEAAASGLPLIVTAVGGLPDVVSDGVNGFITKRNADDIGGKIRMLLEDPERRMMMGREARISAERYSWDQVVRETQRVYSEITDTM